MESRKNKAWPSSAKCFNDCQRAPTRSMNQGFVHFFLHGCTISSYIAVEEVWVNILIPFIATGLSALRQLDMP